MKQKPHVIMDLMQNHGIIGSKSRFAGKPGSRLRLEFYTCLFAMQENNRSNLFTFLIRYRSGDTPSNQARARAGALRAVARGTRAHQPLWEPPGSSCCSSLLAGEFWQATVRNLFFISRKPFLFLFF